MTSTEETTDDRDITRAPCSPPACLARARPGAAARLPPERPLRLIVGFAPGGTTDAVARLAAAEMGRVLGQNVVVENRSGASGNLATQAVVQAPAGRPHAGLAGLQLVDQSRR